MGSMNQIWKDTIKNVLSNGSKVESRNGQSLEIVNYSQSFNLDHTFLTNQERQLSPVYAMAEFLWYLSGEEEITRILAYAQQYVNFANDGVAYGAYGARMLYTNYDNQLFEAIELLRDKCLTRQAVIALWEKDDLRLAQTGKIKDLPCTLSWQFILRCGRLSMICNMRSNDLWLGFPYDVFVNCCILQLIAGELGVRAHRYYHNVGSMHIYEKNVARCKAALDVKNDSSPNTRWDLYESGSLPSQVQLAVDTEKTIREKKQKTCSIQNSLLNDAVSTCATKWGMSCKFMNKSWKETTNAHTRRSRSVRKNDSSE